MAVDSSINNTAGSTALDLNRKISILFKNDPKKVLGVQKCLSDYDESNVLITLVENLRKFVSNPGELILFDYVKPFVITSHQILYEEMRPNGGAVVSTRLVIVRRMPDNSFGFHVRGGEELNLPIFVSHVEKDIRPQNGHYNYSNVLSPGDMILSVNDFNVSKSRLIDFYNFVQLHSVLSLHVINYSMLPINLPSITNQIKWVFTEGQNGISPFRPHSIHSVTVYLKKGLGCSLYRKQNSPAICVQNVVPFSVAHEVGIRDDDQILFVNDVKFFGLSRTEAVMAFHRRSPVSIYFHRASKSKIQNAGYISFPKCPKDIFEALESQNEIFLSLVAKSGFKINSRRPNSRPGTLIIEEAFSLQRAENSINFISDVKISPDSLKSTTVNGHCSLKIDSNKNQSWEYESMFSMKSDSMPPSPKTNFIETPKSKKPPKGKAPQPQKQLLDKKPIIKLDSVVQSNGQSNEIDEVAKNARPNQLSLTNGYHEIANTETEPDYKITKPKLKPDEKMRSYSGQNGSHNEQLSESDQLAESSVGTLKSIKPPDLFKEKQKDPVLLARSSSFVEPTQVAIGDRETSGVRKVTFLFGGYFGLVLEGGRTSSFGRRNGDGGFISSVVVKDIFPQSPLKSSIAIGDRIVSIDDHNVANKHLTEVHSLLTRIERNKKKGESVELMVESKSKLIGVHEFQTRNHEKRIYFDSQITAF